MHFSAPLLSIDVNSPFSPQRYNLDPFGEYNDEAVWNALEVVQLKEHVQVPPSLLSLTSHFTRAHGVMK